MLLASALRSDQINRSCFDCNIGNKGITLVALIITIIVLLILAGVSITFALQGNILNNAQTAVNEYDNASTNEAEIINFINKTIDDKIQELNS